MLAARQETRPLSVTAKPSKLSAMTHVERIKDWLYQNWQEWGFVKVSDHQALKLLGEALIRDGILKTQTSHVMIIKALRQVREEKSRPVSILHSLPPPRSEHPTLRVLDSFRCD